MQRIQKHVDDHNFGPFAAELVDEKSFIGFIGLSCSGFAAHFMPAVEIGWRLACDYWGRGLATEGARAVVEYAFFSPAATRARVLHRARQTLARGA